MSNRSFKPQHAALVVAGIAAAVAGAWWANRPTPSNSAAPAANAASQASTASAPTVAVASDTLPADFWTQSFDTPNGQTLKLSAYKGQPILLNFWASWCPPCVKEMPDIDHFHRDMQSKGWRVIGLAVDGPTPVREFLAKVPVGFDIGLAGFGGTELSQALGNTAGGLPFTVMISADGRIVQRKIGGTTYADLKAWAAAL